MYTDVRGRVNIEKKKESGNLVSFLFYTLYLTSPRKRAVKENEINATIAEGQCDTFKIISIH